MPKKNTLKTYICAYAYDMPHYADFVVKARTKSQAQKIINVAVKTGQLKHVEGESDGSSTNERGFVMGLHPAESILKPSLSNLRKIPANETTRQSEHWSSPNGCHEDCPACAEEEKRRKLAGK